MPEQLPWCLSLLLQGIPEAWAVVQPLLKEPRVQERQRLAKERARQLEVGANSQLEVGANSQLEVGVNSQLRHLLWVLSFLGLSVF